MTVPLIHCTSHLSNIPLDSDWDALILIVTSDLAGVPHPIQERIQTRWTLDHSARSGTHLIESELAYGKRLIVSYVGDLSADYDDVRLYGEAGFNGMKRAREAGSERPVFFCPPQSKQSFHRAIEVAALGALSALWIPLEAREITRGGSIEALGIVLDRPTDEQQAFAAWLSGVELGRSAARDVTGTEPERMSPPKLADYCKRVFKGTDVRCEVVKDPEYLKREYPLLSAVGRASWAVKRHYPQVVRLTYEGGGEVAETLMLAGKGVTYDTGGADLKTGGHMAGMSRDKGGAGAVVGFMLSLAYLKPKKIKVIAEIGAVRNSVGSDSFVTDEIITGHSGVRVRIGNTDAEGRLVLADLLSHLRESAQHEVNPRLFSIATLTGHAGRAVGPYSIALDNGPARDLQVAQLLAEAGEQVGDCFELSRLRREDYHFVRPRTLADDVLSCNNEPSSATPRGHQFPMAFLAIASGLSNHGRQSTLPLPYTHIDIGGSGVSGGDWQHGTPTAAPVLAMLERWRDA